MNTITNTNYPDNASCPQCTHYNAMLGTGEYVGNDCVNGDEVAKCRDCGYQAIVKKAVPEYWTVDHEIRLSDGEHDNDFKTFETRQAAERFMQNDWVLSPRAYRSDEDGNEI